MYSHCRYSHSSIFFFFFYKVAFLKILLHIIVSQCFKWVFYYFFFLYLVPSFFRCNLCLLQEVLTPSSHPLLLGVSLIAFFFTALKFSAGSVHENLDMVLIHTKMQSEEMEESNAAECKRPGFGWVAELRLF